MKNLIISIISVILTASLSFSQNGWVPQQSRTTRNLNSIFFINSMTGWCVGDSNTVLRTTNGGSEWNTVLSSGYYRLSSVFFVNENTGWCCGGITFPLKSGVIYKTTNSGVNWFSIYGGGSSSVNRIFFINGNTGFRADNSSLDFSSSGSVSKTTNGGINWFGGFYGQYEITSVIFKDAITGWAAGYWWSDVLGDSSAVFKTTDGGVSWLIKFREKGGEISEMSFYNDRLWIAGKDSSILFSSDNGENWIRQSTNGRRKFNSVFFINKNTGWAAGYRYPDTTNIIKSTDGGANWFNLKNIHANTLNSLFFIDENTGWAAGNKYPSETGIILKTITGGLTNLNYNPAQIPQEFRLYQNYPNPFNPVTQLEFIISESGFVSLKVYDLLGKEVAVLVNEKLSPGRYKVEFNARNARQGSNLSSGVYFVRMESGDFRDIKRMVLIK